MAKTIISADLQNKKTGAVGVAPELYVLAHVEMPIAEYAAFIVLAGLTNAVPAATTAYVAARLAAGASSGG
jgi:hypothetical protein